MHIALGEQCPSLGTSAPAVEQKGCFTYLLGSPVYTNWYDVCLFCNSMTLLTLYSVHDPL